MFVTSKGIIDGVIGDRFGGHGTQFNDHGMPTYSLPFKIEEAPERTVSFALVLEDKDAYPVTGGFAMDSLAGCQYHAHRAARE